MSRLGDRNVAGLGADATEPGGDLGRDEQADRGGGLGVGEQGDVGDAVVFGEEILLREVLLHVTAERTGW